MTSLVRWLCSEMRFCSLWRNYFVVGKAVNVVYSTMVWAISDCPGTEQNINIKGAMYNFQSFNFQILRCFKRKETKIWIWVDMFMKYTFLLFLMLWRHRSRDQHRPNFNICCKSLLEPFSKNIVKRSCSLINSVLEDGHDYFFLKKCGSRKSNWKVSQLPAQRPFELATKENFAKGLSVCP